MVDGSPETLEEKKERLIQEEWTVGNILPSDEEAESLVSTKEEPKSEPIMEIPTVNTRRHATAELVRKLIRR